MEKNPEHTNSEHISEWEKFSDMYENMAKQKNINDPFYYRHRCVQGLIDGTTYNYN